MAAFDIVAQATAPATKVGKTTLAWLGLQNFFSTMTRALRKGVIHSGIACTLSTVRVGTPISITGEMWAVRRAALPFALPPRSDRVVCMRARD
jgi:hypothetical protein